MGTLTYDGTSVEFDDRVLSHLQIVIVRKFMKGESFLMSWKDGQSIGDGRAAIWLAPSIALYFKFLGSRVPAISAEWLQLLGASADSSTGLLVTNERGEFAMSSDHPGSSYPGGNPEPRTQS